MDPGWLLLFLLLVVESAALGILVLPMWSNKMRGMVLHLFTKVWATNQFVRYTTIALLTLNVVYFLSSMHSVWGVEAFELQTCQAKLEYFRAERNSYITGFGLFLFGVLNRIVSIQHQLHEAKQALKSGGGGDELKKLK